MTVFIKLLAGELLLSTYEYVMENDSPVEKYDTLTGQLLRKCKKLTRIITPQSPWSTSVLKRGGPTLHSFKALSEQVVFLDIIGPPYNDEERNCTYFKDCGSERKTACSIPVPDLVCESSSSGELFLTPPDSADISFTWITPIDFEYQCFAKPYTPHQT
ncbi:hypothetical protein HDV03_003914 [Kappamyces sp. JEL0829]|nr:hypothetical protein HDV03_003914 [Kappamyces sp. JEL0829]